MVISPRVMKILDPDKRPPAFWEVPSLRGGSKSIWTFIYELKPSESNVVASGIRGPCLSPGILYSSGMLPEAGLLPLSSMARSPVQYWWFSS